AHPHDPGRSCHEPQKAARLDREERLQMGRRGGRKRALGKRAPIAISAGALISSRMPWLTAAASASSPQSMTSTGNASHRLANRTGHRLTDLSGGSLTTKVSAHSLLRIDCCANAYPRRGS